MSNTLDKSGLNCPLTVVKAKKALQELSEGDILTVIATDPGSVKDFEAFCEATGNDLIDSKAEDGTYTFVMKKA